MAIAIVQSVGSYTDSAAALTHVVPISVAPTTGNNLIIGIVTPGNVATISVADSQGNTWTVVIRDNSGSSLTAAIAECHISNALTTSDTITITLSASQGCGARVWEASGGLASGWTDAFISGNSAGVGVTTFDSGVSAATAQADEFYFGLLAMSATSAGITPTQGGLNAEATFASTAFIRTGYSYDKVLSATGTQQFSGSYTTARQNVALLATFKAAGGGAGSPTPVWLRSSGM